MLCDVSIDFFGLFLTIKIVIKSWACKLVFFRFFVFLFVKGGKKEKRKKISHFCSNHLHNDLNTLQRPPHTHPSTPPPKKKPSHMASVDVYLKVKISVYVSST